jgi:hypothetical protein
MMTDINFYKIAEEAAKRRFFERKAQKQKIERKKAFEQKKSLSPTQMAIFFVSLIYIFNATMI